MTDKVTTPDVAVLQPADAGGRQVAHPFVLVVVGGGVVVLFLSCLQVWTHPISAALVVLLSLTAASSWLTLRIPSMPISFSISDTFSIAAALLVGPAAGAIAAAVDGLILSFRMQISSRTLPRVLFNMAEPAVANWTAAHVFFALAGTGVVLEGPFRMPRLLVVSAVFAALNFVLSTGLVASAIGLERRVSAVAIWREHFVGLWLTYFGGTFASMLMLVVSQDHAVGSVHPLEALLLMAPLPVILYMTFRHAVGRAEDQIEYLGGLNRVYIATIEALAQTVDAKDQVTHDHVRRVRQSSVRLAHALDVHDELEIQALKAASLLHDVGKVAVPEHILNKPGRLSPSELAIMQRHAPAGADILSVVGFPYPVVPIVRHHHENWDGTGYPDGLAGEAIPVGARILAVVDCFDALTSDRPYRPRLDHAEALKVLSERRGTMYDPRVVDAFFALHAEHSNETVPATRAPVADPHAAEPEGETHADAEPDARDLEAFASLGRALEGAGCVREVGEQIWIHLRDLLGASAFVLFTYDESADALAPAFHSGLPALDPASFVLLGDRLSGWVAATGRSVVNSDARLDLDPAFRDASPLQSALAVPIQASDGVKGVLAFYAEGASTFTTAHQRMAAAAATLALNRLFTPNARTPPRSMAQNVTSCSGSAHTHPTGD